MARCNREHVFRDLREIFGLTAGAMDRAKSTPGAWQALSLLLSLNLLCYMDRYILSAVLPEIQKTFHIGDAKAGWLATAFLVSYMVLSPGFGWLSDRFSRWVIIAFGVAVWSLATAASGWASTFVMLLLARIFVGTGEAAYGPASPTLIADMYPVERRGIVLAWFFAAIPVGSALGYMFGGWVASHHGWRAPFHYAAIPGLALAVMCLFFKDRKTSHAGKVHKRAEVKDYLGLLRIPSYVINVGAQTAMTFAIGGMSFWAPKYFHVTRGLPDLDHVNFVFGLITAVSGLTATLFGGFLGDYFTKRFPSAYFVVSACGMLIAFPCTLLMLWAPFPLAWVFCFLAVFFLFMNIGPANTAIANVTSPTVRASAYALNILVIHALGDAISPPLIGMVADRWNMTVGFCVVSLAMLVAGVLWVVGARFLAKDTAAITQATA